MLVAYGADGRGAARRVGHPEDVMRDLPPEPPSGEITPEAVYQNRREFLKNGALTLGTAAAVGGGLVWLAGKGPPPDALPAEASAVEPLDYVVQSMFDTDEAQTSEQAAITYNNFYEFGFDKDDPARHAHTLKTRPWTIEVEGEVARPQ